MKLKSTPGPWKLNDEVDFDSFISGNTGKFENVICQSPHSHRKKCAKYKPWHDNKHLIVTSPDLLQRLLDHDGSDSNGNIVLRIPRKEYIDLIKRATGLKSKDIEEALE
jgi:hypothetical protein